MSKIIKYKAPANNDLKSELIGVIIAKKYPVSGRKTRAKHYVLNDVELTKLNWLYYLTIDEIDEYLEPVGTVEGI